MAVYNCEAMDKAINDSEKAQEHQSEILLVHEKAKKKVNAVKGIGKDGVLETIDPDSKNQNQFMRVDKHGDIFSNFFSNFQSQLKNPTQFSFFKIPVEKVEELASKIEEYLRNLTVEGKAFLEKYMVNGQQIDKQENQNIMETMQTKTETGDYKFSPEQINWEFMSNLGLSKEKLEAKNLLEPLLKGYKTNELVPVNINLGSAKAYIEARLALQSNKDGEVVLNMHPIHKEPKLQFPFWGHEFTKEDKENLLSMGNMGRVVDLTYPNNPDLKIPSVISVDRLTNELVAFRTEWMRIPEEIKGVKLNDEQKQTLAEGKPLFIEGMTSKKGESFDASVQFNADKGHIEFLFDRNNEVNQKQSNQEGQQEAPREFRDKVLDDKQYEKFKEGQTVYIDGLVDKKGQSYQGYITFDKETGKTDFSFNNPDKLREKVQPKEENKTQVAVNSEGKTNEPTKHSNEPLKSGQQDPDSKMQQEQAQQQEDKPSKSKGRKI